MFLNFTLRQKFEAGVVLRLFLTLLCLDVLYNIVLMKLSGVLTLG